MTFFLKNKFILCTLYLLICIPSTCFPAGYVIKNAKNKVRAGIIPKFCLCAGYPPPACTSENRSKYILIYGEIFKHIHHYCWGLDKLNKQLQSGKPSRFWLENVIHEFDYVLGHKDPKRSMKALVFTKKAQVLLLLNKNIEAVKSFYNAIKFNKKYIPAYVYLSNFLLRSGDRTGARKILKFGLKYNPGSKMLKKQFVTVCRAQ